MVKLKGLKGFTLIELLVVVSILAVLTAVGVLIFKSVLQNSRDQKRIRDLETISQALELYRYDQGYYPRTIDIAIITQGYILRDQPFKNPSLNKTYLEIIPVDPTSSTGHYMYHTRPRVCNNSTVYCSGYCLYAEMEDPSNARTSANCDFLTPTNRYSVSQR